MNSSIKVVLLVAAAAVFSASAVASSDAEKKCASTMAEGVTPDQVIEACTDVVREAENPMTLAPVYYNRGNAYFDKKDWASAIADYSHALQLRPNFANAMRNRGIAKKHIGDMAGGDADLAAAKAM